MPLAPDLAAARIALVLDAPLPRELMAHVIGLCQERPAHLLCLAPPPCAIAVSRLEPHLAILEQARVAWEIRPCAGDLEAALPPLLETLTDIALLVCDSRSALARCRLGHAIPTLILLAREVPPRRPEANAADQPVWLAPRLHRGF